MADSALTLPDTVQAHGGLVLAPRPFAREEEVTLHAMPLGLSVAEMIAALEGQGALDPALRPWVRVTIGSERLAREFWSHRRPAVDDAIVVEVAPMAGSNAVRTLMQIAVIALSAFAGAVVGGAYGAVAGAMAAAAVNVGGMMLVNAVAPIKQPELSAREQRYSLDGGSNAARPYEAIPVVLGRRRIYPPRCANWYTVTVANVVYLRMMFQPCVTWVDHESPRLGQTALESYDGVTVRWATRPDEDLEPAFFNRTPAEDSLALPIKTASGWVTRSAPLEADALSLDVAFMAGLFESKESSGNPKNRSVTFEFRYGPKGGDPNAAANCPFAPGGLMTFTRDKLDAYRVGYEWAVTRGEYDVHIRRITNEESNNPRISDELTWICLRAFRNEAAVRDASSKPWIEIELQASDQLNGVPDDFNFVATSIVPTATADGPGVLITTQNPADLFLAASYAPLSDVELDDDERDFAAIAAWRATCVDQGWTCDLAADGEISVGELLQRTAAAGRARPTLDFGALSVVVDWAKPLPRQMFTPRNVTGFQGEVSVPSPVHALRVRFSNAAKDYADDVVTCFGWKPDGSPYDLATATIYETVEVRDKTDWDEIEWEGGRMLAERRLRPERFTFTQDVESLTAKEGARAWLAHHVALVGEISGRVGARVVDAGDATRKGLRLDETVVMVADRNYDLAWRPSADAELVVFALETVAGSDDVVWFADPAPALANQPLPGDLVTVFVNAVELLDVIVDRITPKDGLKATISCVPYAEALQHIGDGEPIPAYRTGVSRPPTLGSAVLQRRDQRAIDQLFVLLGEAVTQAGTGVEALRALQLIMQDQLGDYAELTDLALAEAADAKIRILSAIAEAAGRDLDVLAQIRPPSGRPVGATIDNQVRLVENANEAIAENYTLMQVGFANAAAALSFEAITRAAEDEALSAYQIALAAVVDSNYSAVNSTLAALTTAQSATATALATLTTNFNSNVATVSSQLTALSTADTALASNISTLSSTVGSHTSSISTIATTLATLNGQVSAAWGVDVTVDGRSIGIKGINSGAYGGWIFDGDYFFFRTPGGDKPLVSITGSLIYLATNVRIGGNLVLDGTLTFTKIGANELTETSVVGDGSYVTLTTSDQVCATMDVYVEAGVLDISTGLAVQNTGADAGVIAGVYIDGTVLDDWPVIFPGSFTARDTQLSYSGVLGVGWHTVELRARTLDSGSTCAKVLAVMRVTKRTR